VHPVLVTAVNTGFAAICVHTGDSGACVHKSTQIKSGGQWRLP
jgi:hypothetical protein